MNTKNYLFILSIFSIIFLFTFVNAEETNFLLTEDIFTNLGLLENTEETYLDYGGVLYPPETELRKQGLNLESYKQLLRNTAPVNRNSSVANIWGTSPLSGTVHIPVLLVQFSDNQATYTQSQLYEAFNSNNYVVNNISGLSLSKYYYKQSYGDLNLVFDVYDWRTAPNTYSYYSQNNSTSFDLGIDTINLFNPYIDYTQYDNDNDGRLDGLVLIYPGVGVNNPNGIWPHTRILRENITFSVDGKYLGNIAFVPEKSTGNSNAFTIDVPAHEFAHVLGLMDLYSKNPNTGSQSNGAIRQMTMMAYSVPSFACAIKPINLDVWSRYFFGWIEPEILTTDSNKNISLRSVNDYPEAVILRNNNFGAREFFIIENRYRNLTDPNNLDKCMFGDSTYDTGGFAIYHVDEQYIEENYPTNSIMYDSDSNYCGGNSHPGIVYEQNYVTSCSTSITVDRTDLYFNSEINNCNLSRFDENQHMCPGPFWFPILDLTTSSYTGINNTLVRFQAISPASQYTMTAKMLVGEETVTPTANPVSGTYPQNTQVTLSTTTPQSTIYYTTNGTEPTVNSTIYTTPINLTEGITTIKAMARRNGYYVSDIMSNTYTITGTVEPPISTLPSGYYSYGTTLELYTPTAGASIRYTTNGTEPNESSTLYTGPISITFDFTLKAKAYKTGYTSSQTTTYIYDTGAAPENLIVDFTFQGIDSNATIDNDQNQIIINTPYGTNKNGLVPIIQVEEGCSVDPESGIPQNFNNPVNYTVSSVTGQRIYTVTVINNPSVFAPIASVPGGNFTEPITVELTTLTPGAVIKYTTNGSFPMLSSNTYTGPITINSTTTLKAKAYLYVGPGISVNDSSSKQNSGRSTPNLIPTTVIWQTSSLLTEEYVFPRKTPSKTKQEIIIEKEKSKSFITKEK